MFIIEKCLVKEVKAKYSATDPHIWIPAWNRGKSFIEASMDEAINSFYKLTGKVRCVPYRLRTLTHEPVTVAAINTDDAVPKVFYFCYWVLYLQNK